MSSLLNRLADKKIGLAANLTTDSVAGFIIVMALVAIPVIAFSSSLLLQLQVSAHDQPAKPAQLDKPVVTSGDASLTVAWTRTSSRAATTTAYSIRHIESRSADKSDGNWTLLDKVWKLDIGGTLRHIISGLTNGTGYDVQVRAENQTTLGDWSPTENGTPATSPGPLTNIKIVPGNQQLTVSWEPPKNNGGSPITEYRLRYKKDGPISAQNQYQPAHDGVGVTSPHTITGLTNGQGYTVHIGAVNSVGWKIANENITYGNTPVATFPGPLINIRIVPGHERLTVSWEPPKDNDGSPITEYRLRYKKDGEANAQNPYLPVHNGVGVTSPHTITGLTNGQRYTVQMWSVNSAVRRILDEDITYGNTPVATISIEAQKPTVNEGNNAIFVLSSPETLSSDLEVKVNVTGGAGYTAVSGETKITIPSRSKEANITISTVADKVDELNGTITAALIAGTGYVIQTAKSSASITIQDNDMAQAIVNPTQPKDVDEGNRSSYSINLSAEPSANVIITATSDNPDVKVSSDGKSFASSAKLMFTPTDYGVKTMYLRADEDSDADPDKAQISHAASGAAEYTTINIVHVSVKVKDDDVALTSSSNTQTIGGNTAHLSVEPRAGDVRIILLDQARSRVAELSAPLTVTVKPQSTDDNTRTDAPPYPQRFDIGSGRTLTAVDISFDKSISGQKVRLCLPATSDMRSIAGNRDLQVIHYSRNQWRPLPNQSRESDSSGKVIRVCADTVAFSTFAVGSLVDPGITVPSKLEVDEGKTKSYTVQLKNRPRANVSLKITSSDSGDVSVSSDGDSFYKSVTLQFSRANWNIAQKITLRGKSDSGSADDQVTVSHVASGGGYDDIRVYMKVTVDDDDWDRDPPQRRARIYRIEPEVESITLRAGESVRLEANVYSLRGGIDNSLGNAVTFRWRDGRASGSFSKVGRNDGTDEREIIYTAPDDPGRYTVEATLSHGTYSECSGSRSQCTAEFRIRVLKSRTAPTPTSTPKPKPVNPSIKIPTVINDSNGTAYLTFTPADGGEFKSANFSFSVPSGAIPSGELIGVRMAETLNDAGQVKINTDRYLLSGEVYTVSAVNRTGNAYEQYQLDKSGTACIPLPERFLGNVGNIYMVKIQPNGSIVVVSSKIMVADRGFEVCGNFSWLPAHLAVGKRSPIVNVSTPVPTAIAPTPEVSPAPLLPVTGGAQPPSQTLTTIFLLMGGAAILLGVLITATRAKKHQGAVRVAHKPRSQTQSRQR